jgi:hypothetical protein
MIDNKKVTLLIIFLTIFQTNSIRFKLVKNDSKCFKIPGQNSYIIEYVIAGEGDTKVKTEVYDNEQLIATNENVN